MDVPTSARVFFKNTCNTNTVNDRTLCWYSSGSSGDVASFIEGGWNGYHDVPELG